MAVRDDRYGPTSVASKHNGSNDAGVLSLRNPEIASIEGGSADFDARIARLELRQCLFKKLKRLPESLKSKCMHGKQIAPGLGQEQGSLLDWAQSQILKFLSLNVGRVLPE